MAEERLFPWMPEFYCDDMYWLVTEGGVSRGLFSLEDDARQLFNAIDPVAVDGDVHLWRLNGGHLCRPHVEAKTVDGVTPSPALTDQERDLLRCGACVFRVEPYKHNHQSQQIAALMERIAGVSLVVFAREGWGNSYLEVA